MRIGTGPYWLMLLRHFENTRFFNNGPTIPFIIGARAIIEPGKSLLSIADFFAEINVSTAYVTIMKCRDLREYVIGLLDDETNAYQLKYDMYKRIGNLFITDGSFKELHNLEEIVNILETDYNGVIGENTFSKNHGKWGYFTEKEAKCLQEI